MSQLSVPPAVTQNIARARSLIKRNEVVRGIGALSSALEAFLEVKIIGKARCAVEVNILECVGDLNMNDSVKALIQNVSNSSTASIVYTPGREAALLAVLGIISKALAEEEAAREQVATEAGENRKKIIFSKAEVLLKAGKGARGKAMLRRLGEELGHEPAVLTTIGSLLVECGFSFDAIDFFEEAIEAFPRDPASYGPLAACYTEFQEFEKGERLYLNAIREFGTHPRTMINLAKLYIAWNKRYKAFGLLSQVLEKDPDNEEAKELFTLVDR